MNQEQKYQHDYSGDIKELQVINRQQSLVWNTMIETYQKKINHLQKKRMIEKAQANLSQSQIEIKDLYQQQCQFAANSYQLDLYQLKKIDLEKEFEKEKANLNEYINEVKKSYEQISQKLQPPIQQKPKQCQFISGASSDYTIILALRNLQNQRTFISLQSFYPECYISNFQDCENITVIAIRDIKYKATKNSIQNQLLLANADNKTLNCYKISYDKDQLIKDLLFQQELEHNIDSIHITKDLYVIAINKLYGFVYMLNKNLKQLIYRGDHVVVESQYFDDEDMLRLSNPDKIITFSNLQTNQKYDVLLTDQYKALLYYHTNMPNFHLMYIQHPQIINKEYFVYVNKQNKIRVYDFINKQKKKFKVPTQNIQIEFLNYFQKTNKIVFCDSQGQTYKVEKFTNLIQ